MQDETLNSSLNQKNNKNIRPNTINTMNVKEEAEEYEKDGAGPPDPQLVMPENLDNKNLQQHKSQTNISGANGGVGGKLKLNLILSGNNANSLSASKFGHQTAGLSR